MEAAFGIFIAAMARWAWPGCAESARCRRWRGCRVCTLLVPCDEAIRQIDGKLPRMRTVRTQ